MLEAALIRLAEAEKFIDPTSLIDRLERLGGGAGPMATRSPEKKKAVAPASEAQYVAEPTAKQTPAAQAEAASPPAPAPARQELSTEQKNQVNADPAVQQVMSLFGGELVDVVKDAGPTSDSDGENGPARESEPEPSA